MIENLIITNHALDRFKQRYDVFNEPLKNTTYKQFLISLLKASIKIDKPKNKTLNNKMEYELTQHVRHYYRKYGGWIFVIIMNGKGEFILTTVYRGS